MAPSKTSQYVLVIDAGSSGSRIHIFKWDISASGKREKVQVTTLPDIIQEDSKHITPGISQYASKQHVVWKDHLKVLFEHAYKVVPRELHSSTPAYLYATAGMRLLPDDTKQSMVLRVCDEIRQNTDFDVQDCSVNVKVIDGELEGLYGWLALNYLLGPAKEMSSDVTYGFMDMGGASAQIAFAPNETEAKRHADDLFNVSLRTLDGSGHSFGVFVSTWLGYGANQARKTYLDELVKLSKKDKARIEDPCSHPGLKTAVAESPGSNDTIEVYGTGSFGKCLTSMLPMLNKHLPCKDEPCLFNGVHVPAIDFSTNKFVGVSEYWYTAHDILGTEGKYDFEEFRRKTQTFCQQPWETVVANLENGDYHGVGGDYLSTACFKSSWIINILHEGFGIPLNLKSSHNHEVDFLDPFQSAKKIKGQEFTWTLGAALLYVSSSIPSNDSTQKVGITTPHNLFLPGGPNESVPQTHKGSTLWYFMLVALLMFLLYYSLRFNISRKLPLLKHALSDLLYRLHPRKRWSRYDDPEREAMILQEEESHGSHYRLGSLARSSVPLANSVSSISLAHAKNTSDTGLGTSTSMPNLQDSSPGLPSRVSSRVSLREQTRSNDRDKPTFF